jgi:hypothetical protein
MNAMLDASEANGKRLMNANSLLTVNLEDDSAFSVVNMNESLYFLLSDFDWNLNEKKIVNMSQVIKSAKFKEFPEGYSFRKFMKFETTNDLIGQAMIGRLKDMTRDHNKNFIDFYLMQNSAKAIAYVRKRIEGLNQLLQNRISPFLISLTNLKFGLRKLDASLQLKDFERQKSSYTSFYSREIFFTATGSGNLKIHIPINVIRRTTKKLFRFIDFPVSYGNNLFRYRINTEAPLLAIDKDNFEFLTEKNLDNCIHQNNVYSCKNLEFTLTNTSSYCLTSLFLGDAKNIAKNCLVQKQLTGIFVKQLKKGDFLVHHYEQNKVRIFCDDGSPIEEVETSMEGVKRIKLTSGCVAFGEGYSLNGTDALNEKSNFSEIQVLMKLRNTVMFDNMKNNSVVIDNNTMTLQNKSIVIDNGTMFNTYWYISISVLVFLLIQTLGIILYVTRNCYCFVQGRTGDLHATYTKVAKHNSVSSTTETAANDNISEVVVNF